MNPSANAHPSEDLEEQMSFRLSLLRLMTVPHPVSAVNDSSTIASRQLEELSVQLPLRKRP